MQNYGTERALAIPERYPELDLLRTIAIALMVLYHTAFDLSFFFAVPLDPFAGGWFLLQRVTATLFLLLVGTGFAISFGRMVRRRAGRSAMLRKYSGRSLWLFACAALVSVATYFVAGDQYVRFGALHLIATAVLLLPFLMPLKEWNVLLAAIIFVLGRWISGITVTTSLFFPLGLTPAGFASVDYLPLVPWLAPVLLGAALGNFLYNRSFLARHLPKNRFTSLLGLPGRHALLLYLVHQPVVLGLLWMLRELGK